MTAWQFEYASKVCSGTISSRISCVYRPRKKGQKTPQWRLLHEKRLQEQQQVMDAIILSLELQKKPQQKHACLDRKPTKFSGSKDKQSAIFPPLQY
ncbi:hypothetical protein O1V64_15515 [Rouxiella badensis]|nr:hypothetical protein O1V64_15515 [Rouxiella badensis]